MITFLSRSIWVFFCAKLCYSLDLPSPLNRPPSYFFCSFVHFCSILSSKLQNHLRGGAIRWESTKTTVQGLQPDDGGWGWNFFKEDSDLKWFIRMGSSLCLCDCLKTFGCPLNRLRHCFLILQVIEYYVYEVAFSVY